MKIKLPELLAPVASMDHLKIAINAGASSIYLSGKKYGARKFAENFTLEEIEKATSIAHLHNVKVYVTVNTLIKEDEIEDVLNYLSFLYRIGVDAVLVQDLGLLELINRYIPNLKVHASTQMTLENQLKLDYIEKKGVKRVVLPREMTKEEIANLNTKMELEIFAHGALCYSYSGQCLMSSFKGGRSGNRGSCAQPCRQKYRINKKEDYYLSPKDLSLFDCLEEIVNLDIDCIKIEGRMRNKEYLAIVVHNYRQALNKLKSRKKYENEEINLVFNRGFTKGQFMHCSSKSLRPGHLGLNLGFVYDCENNKIAIKLKDSIKTIPKKGDGLLILNKNKSYGFEVSKDPILTTENLFNKGKIKKLKNTNRKDRILIIKRVKENKQINFDLTDCDVYLTKNNDIIKKTKEIENSGNSYIKSKLRLTFSVKNNYPVLKGNLKGIKEEVIGEVPFEKPIKKAITQDTIKKQLLKLDKYPFKLENININYKNNLFLPISEINKLRRRLLKKLEEKVISSYKHEDFILNYKKEKTSSKILSEKNISFYTNNLNHLKEIKGVKRVYIEIPPFNSRSNEININHMVSFIEEACKIGKDKDYKLIWKWPDIAHENMIKALTKTKGILNKLNYNLEIMNPDFNSEYGPSSLNITNSESIKSLNNYKLVTLSPELSKNDLKNIMKNITNTEKVEIIVQGNIEIMKSRNRLLNKKEIKKIKKVYLEDNKGNKYPVKENLSPEVTILNSEELSLLEEIPYLKSINISNFAIDGRWKNMDYLNVIDIYNSAINGDIKKEELLKYSPKNTEANF